MALVTAAPYLALLSEHDASLKSHALTSLNGVVDQLWAEIANNLVDLQELFDDSSFPNRNLAALVISKVYYNLGDFSSAVTYALCAGVEFDVDEKSQYVETIVSHCIDLYIADSSKAYTTEGVAQPDKRLLAVFEHMVHKCLASGEVKLALGISMESYRLDIVTSILRAELAKDEDAGGAAISYVLMCAKQVLSHAGYRTEVLLTLFELLLELHRENDFFTIFRIIVQLNDLTLAARVLRTLIVEDKPLVAYQGAFDLVGSASQELLDNVSESLIKDKDFDTTQPVPKRLLHILSGVPTCDLDITFLCKNKSIDISILNTSKSLLEGRNSIFHSAITFSNAFMHMGTTDDSFFRKNLEWLNKACNWSKFSATAALGVIHKGNLSQGLSILKPYLPETVGSPYTKGGSLFALGLIFAGHGRSTLGYLKKFVLEQGNSAGTMESDVMLHGACLGSGVAGMGCNSESLYEALKVVLYSDSAVSGQAAGLAMGLVMLGSGNAEAINDMFTYAQETQHEHIIRGLAVGIALLNFGREDEAMPIIDKLLDQEHPILRYGGVFTLSLAYAGTGNNDAIKKLLHFAVSDPSDDVRRASVLGLGFLLIRDHTATPQIVDLLSQSHNPHVRYGTAMALGISCGGRALPAALEVLEPLTKDPVDFVRQGALQASAMILIQQNETLFPRVKDFHKLYLDTIKNKHEDALAKFGATLAQGIIDAGGRNVTINLENSNTNTLNVKAVVGLAIFAQSWFWFPFAHFLSLSFALTAVIGVNAELKVPKFELNVHAKPEFFQYPPKVEEAKEKQPDKITKAVLSTTVRANARAKKQQAKKEKGEKDDNMEVDEAKVKADGESKPATEKASDDKKAAEEKEKTEKLERTAFELVPIRYLKVPYKISNLSRVLPNQANYVSFIKDKYFPVRKSKGLGGIVVLEDLKPGEPIEVIKTVRQMNITEAPLPEPFTLSGEDLLDEIEW
ncbi:26S proteasome regulatory complex, non-ATPase subcomplex, Rpn2/Psmd1 subunit [Metschnikowia bicuspidata]|uniref:26S proteasome regulatory subunit RPN2 n=1 Tax=Metschnikowia bicuspidata TaxID=27322 RepID=A0A4P9ZJV8_9ASCO|nr:26S proteasome regulatory complex, non-ATPase subcomplex, Rpn2/Psmd1 subunit [Metschnikowia bicuspidata]